MVKASGIIDRPTGRTNLAMNAMRIIAAVLVVLNHLRALFFVDFSVSDTTGIWTVIAYAGSSLGHQAVIVFFVLSGFWVGGSVIKDLREKRFSPSRYATARLVRLWIVLLPALALTQILDRIGTFTRGDSDIYAGSTAYHTVVPIAGPSAALDPVTTIGNVVFLMGIDVPAMGTNTPLWSLGAEFWYYLLFPVLLVLVWRGVPWRVRLMAGVVSGAALGLLANPLIEHPSAILALFPAWLAGAAVAAGRTLVIRLVEKMPPMGLGAVRGFLCVVVIATAVIDSRSLMPFSVYVLAAATALLVASLITDVSAPRVCRLLRPLSWSAEWSYSLYAIHMPVLAMAAAMLVPLATDRWQVSPASLTLGLLVLIGVLAAAYGFFLLFEKNTDTVRRALHKRVATH